MGIAVSQRGVEPAASTMHARQGKESSGLAQVSSMARDPVEKPVGLAVSGRAGHEDDLRQGVAFRTCVAV